jgi:isoamylase
VRRLVVESLRHWAIEMGVDGFRFDLASIFLRDDAGGLNFLDPPIISEISTDPVLRRLRLIAEPWEGDGQGYAFGRGFPGLSWGEWNDRFRDDIRRFVKGDNGLVPGLMTRLYGSADAFPDDLAGAYRPTQSVNFVDAHDGLCLYDLVAYTDEGQHSWDCGWHGDQGLPPDILRLRKQQLKNFFCLLLLANGTPMFCAGDEFLNTHFGNGNPYDLDNEVVWLDWRRLESNRDMFRFVKGMIAFRKSHPAIGSRLFWQQTSSLHWYGVGPDVDLSNDSHSLAFSLRGSTVGEGDLYVMISAWWNDLVFTIQEGKPGEWRRAVDTGQTSPSDFLEPGQEQPLRGLQYTVGPRSIVVLVRP